MLKNGPSNGKDFTEVENPWTGLLGLPVQGVPLAKPAVFFKFKLVRFRALVLCCGIISALALRAGECNIDLHRWLPVLALGLSALSYALAIR
jgi:hypothetical protein